MAHVIVLLFTVRERLTEYGRNRKISMSLWTAMTLCIESYVTRSTRYCHSRSIDRSITDLQFALADYFRSASRLFRGKVRGGV